MIMSKKQKQLFHFLSPVSKFEKRIYGTKKHLKAKRPFSSVLKQKNGTKKTSHRLDSILAQGLFSMIMNVFQVCVKHKFISPINRI